MLCGLWNKDHASCITEATLIAIGVKWADKLAAELLARPGFSLVSLKKILVLCPSQNLHPTIASSWKRESWLDSTSSTFSYHERREAIASHSIASLQKMMKKFIARIKIWKRSLLDLHLPFLQARVVLSCRVTKRRFPFTSRRCLLALSRVVFPFFVKLILAFSNRSPSYLIQNFTGEKVCCWMSHRPERKSLSNKFTPVAESYTFVVGCYFALLSLIMVFTKIAPAVHLRHAENLI